MPITDVPPSPPPSSPPSPPSSPPPQPPNPSWKRRKRANYDEMEQHELLLVIDELEDERSRLRRREGIWVSVLAHIVIFLAIAFLPRFLPPQVRVVDSSDSLKEHEKDITRLTLPPSALKGLRSAPAPRSVPAPPQPKALEAAPAPTPPAPAPPRQQAQPQQQAPQPVQKQPVTPPSQPLAPSPQSRLDAPRQAAPTQPNFSSSAPSPGDAVREAAQAAAKSGIPMGGGGGLPGAPGHGRGAGLQGGAQVLTDTGDWDPTHYVQRVVYDTEHAWYPIIPEEVNPPLLKKGIVGIRFKIGRDGRVLPGSMVLEAPSHDTALDKAAWGSIVGASPYPAIPAEFKGPYLELRFGFYYNQDPGLR